MNLSLGHLLKIDGWKAMNYIKTAPKHWNDNDIDDDDENDDANDDNLDDDGDFNDGGDDHDDDSGFNDNDDDHDDDGSFNDDDDVNYNNVNGADMVMIITTMVTLAMANSNLPMSVGNLVSETSLSARFVRFFKWVKPSGSLEMKYVALNNH